MVGIHANTLMLRMQTLFELGPVLAFGCTSGLLSNDVLGCTACTRSLLHLGFTAS